MKFMSLIVSLVALMSIDTVLACSCEFLSAKEVYENSEAIFLGIPTNDSLKRAGEPELGGDLNKTRFSVVRNYKKANWKSLIVESYDDSGSNCGANFKKDDGLWLIFASKNSNGTYSTDGCNVRGLTSPEGLKFLRELNNI